MFVTRGSTTAQNIIMGRNTIKWGKKQLKFETVYRLQLYPIDLSRRFATIFKKLQEKETNENEKDAKLLAKVYHGKTQFLYRIAKHGIIDYTDVDIEHWRNRRLIFIHRKDGAHRIPAVLICPKYIKIFAKLTN